MGGFVKDLTGQRFGRYVVVRRLANDSRRQTRWLCRCDCGVSKEVLGASLRTGKTRSCGCFRDEFRKTHGSMKGGHASEFAVWRNMKQRVRNPKNPSYKNYGGRGITLCDRWETFENFIADMGHRPSPEHSIERIDNNRGYYPENCKWATTFEQSWNRRSNRILEYKGETKCLAEWALEKGIHVQTIVTRLRSGYTVEESLEMPPRMCGNRVTNLRKANA